MKQRSDDEGADEIASALFAAGARERAPAALRDLLLRQLRELPAARELPAPSRGGSAMPGSATSTRLRLWLPLAAAALTLIGVGWSVLRTEPPAPLVSRELVPARPVSQPPAVPATKGVGQVSELDGAADVTSAGEAPPPARAARLPRPKPSSHAEQSKPREASAAPPGEVASSDVAPGERPPAAQSSPRASVAEQLGVLQRARRDLRAGAPADVLQLLAAHEAELAASEFAAEARLLRIEALAGARRHAEARALARDFVQRYPHDPLVDRARQFADGRAAPR